MRRFAFSLLLVFPALAGCGDLIGLQAGGVVHPGSAHSPYVESFNEVLDAQLDEPLSTPLLVGYDVAVTAYGFTGLGFTQMQGSSEATLTNGTTQELALRARDFYVRTAIPFYAMGATEPGPAGGFAAPISLQVEADVIMRRSTVEITQTPTTGNPIRGVFESSDVVFRPALTGVVRGSALTPGAAANNLSVRASLGYDLPIAADGFDATFGGFLAREYTVSGGSTTGTGEEQQPGYSGLHARLSLVFGF